MIFSRSLTETITIEKHRNPKNNPETWYVNKNFQITMECYISSKRSRKRLFTSFYKNCSTPVVCKKTFDAKRHGRSIN